MLIWSRKGRAAAGALAVTLFAGVFLLPLAVILLSSLSKQWNGLLPTGFTFAHFVNAFRGAAWDSLFSSLMVGFCASLLALLCGMWAALIAQAELIISPDTSVVHMAAAWNKPLIAVYKDVLLNNRLWAPGYDNARQIIVKCGKVHQHRGLVDRIIAALPETL